MKIAKRVKQMRESAAVPQTTVENLERDTGVRLATYLKILLVLSEFLSTPPWVFNNTTVVFLNQHPTLYLLSTFPQRNFQLEFPEIL